MKFDLKHAKLMRVDKSNNVVLVWYGDSNIYAYKMAGKEIDTYPINISASDRTSFKFVKQQMRELINDNNQENIK